MRSYTKLFKEGWAKCFKEYKKKYEKKNPRKKRYDFSNKNI